MLEDELIVEWMAEMGLTASALGMERFGFLPLARQNRILLLGFFITWVSHDFVLCHLFFICLFFGYPNVSILSIQYIYNYIYNIDYIYYIYILYTLYTILAHRWHTSRYLTWFLDFLDPLILLGWCMHRLKILTGGLHPNSINPAEQDLRRLEARRVGWFESSVLADCAEFLFPHPGPER